MTKIWNKGKITMAIRKEWPPALSCIATDESLLMPRAKPPEGSNNRPEQDKNK